MGSAEAERWGELMLYVIGHPNALPLVKIGISNCPTVRLSQLRGSGQRSSTYMPKEIDRKRLVLLYQQHGGRHLETQLHRYFHDRWRGGEWYELGEAAVWRVRAAIAELYSHSKPGAGVDIDRQWVAPALRRAPEPEAPASERAERLAKETLRWLVDESDRPAAEPAPPPEPFRPDVITTTVAPEHRAQLLALVSSRPGKGNRTPRQLG